MAKYKLVFKDKRPYTDIHSKAQAVIDYYELGLPELAHVDNVLTELFGSKYDNVKYTTDIAEEDLAKVYDVMKKDYQNQINKHPKSHEVPTSAFDYFGLIQRKIEDSPDWETLKKSKDFVLKRLFKELDEEKAKPMSIEQENNIARIKSDIRKRVKEIKHVPNDIYDANPDPRPVSEIAKHVSAWIDAFLDNDDELSDEYRKPFRNIQKDSRLLNKVSNELKTQFDALDLDLNNLEDAPDISRIIWKEMKRFTRR